MPVLRPADAWRNNGQLTPPKARMFAQNAAWRLLIAGSLQALVVVTRSCPGIVNQAFLSSGIGFIVFIPAAE